MRTREVSIAISFVPPPLAFIKWPVVEIVAERASVVSATRIVGSGPLIAVSTGDVITGVDAAGAGHAGCVRRGRVASRVCC